MTGPAIVIAHMEGPAHFPAAVIDRLNSIGRVLDPEPIADWNSERGRRLLPEAEIIVGESDEVFFFSSSSSKIQVISRSASDRRNLLLSSLIFLLQSLMAFL